MTIAIRILPGKRQGSLRPHCFASDATYRRPLRPLGLKSGAELVITDNAAKRTGKTEPRHCD